MGPEDPEWYSSVNAPMVVSDFDAWTWDEQADFVVVGCGGAGVTAALRARLNGLKVIVLDAGEGGGATRASGGVVYAGGGTRIQLDNGEEDSPDNMFNYLKLETQGIVQDKTLRRFCEQSAENIDWLMAQGVQFSGPVWKEKTSYPNVDYFLYHSDNSLLPHYAAHATPAARGHRGVIRRGRSAVNLGGAIYDPLKQQCLDLGVEIHTRTEVQQLVTGSDGRVIGVRALQIPPESDVYREHQRCSSRGTFLKNTYPFFLPGAKKVHAWADRLLARAAQIEREERRWISYRAVKGVCLSAGGFIFNRKMVAKYCPAFRPGMPLGTHGDNGSGIRLGESVGGVTAHMDRATAWRFINPPRAWSRGVIVDDRGDRFVNESAYGATIGDAMVYKAGGRAWLILDDELVRQAWREIWPTKVLPFQWQLGALNMLFGKKKYRTIEAVCAACGFDEMTFRQTVSETGSAASATDADRLGKPAADIKALTAPFHVMDVSLGARLLPCTVLTMGGLVVSEDTGQVRNRQGEVIEGLYAAGRTAVGIPSHLYMSGLSIADCVFSGLRAADHVSRRV